MRHTFDKWMIFCLKLVIESFEVQFKIFPIRAFLKILPNFDGLSIIYKIIDKHVMVEFFFGLIRKLQTSYKNFHLSEISKTRFFSEFLGMWHGFSIVNRWIFQISEKLQTKLWSLRHDAEKKITHYWPKMRCNFFTFSSYSEKFAKNLISDKCIMFFMKRVRNSLNSNSKFSPFKNI